MMPGKNGEDWWLYNDDCGAGKTEVKYSLANMYACVNYDG